MAEEAENQAPADAERRPSALDKLKKAASLAAVVSTVGSSVDKAGPAASPGSRASKPPPAPPEAPGPPGASVGLGPRLCSGGRPRAP